MPIEVGQEAPDFELRDTDGQTVRLSDFRGKKNVLLIFYPVAFSRGCHSEFCQLRDENTDLVSDEHLEVFGISVDSGFALRAWKKQENFPNRFLSDFWPHGAVSQAYDAFDANVGTSLRTTVLIDKQGVIRYIDARGHELRDQTEWRKAMAEVG